MVDIKVAFEALKNEVDKLGYAEEVYLKLKMENHPIYGSQTFWVSFTEDDDSLSTVEVTTGSIIANIDLDYDYETHNMETDELVRIYGEWYEPLAGYEDDEDAFFEVPVENAMRALESLNFDSYEVMSDC